MPERFFLITSYGRSATYWLAGLLHRPPLCICSHGPIHPPHVDFSGDSFPDAAAVRAHENLEAFYAMSPRRFLSSHLATGQAQVYGNVHAYSANSVRIMRESGRIGREVRVVNLMRHPVGRVESLYRRLEYEFTFNPHCHAQFVADYEARVVPALETWASGVSRPAEMSESLQCWLYCVVLVTALDALDGQAPFPQLPMERLTGDLEALAWLLHYVGFGYLSLDDAIIERFGRGARRNALRAKQVSTDSYARWPATAQALMRRAVQHHALAELYEGLFYPMPAIVE